MNNKKALSICFGIIFHEPKSDISLTKIDSTEIIKIQTFKDIINNEKDFFKFDFVR